MASSASNNQSKTSLTRQIKISGLIASFLFLGVIFLGIAFIRQIQSQNLNYEVGTLFSDRSVTQLQREVLRLRSVVANSNLADEEAIAFHISLVQSRMIILDDSLAKIHPSVEILDKYNEIVLAWNLLTPQLAEWQANPDDKALQTEILIQIDAIELTINDIVRLYELLRLARGDTFIQTGERLGLFLGIMAVLFILFMLTVIYNTYRFIRERIKAEDQLAVYAAELERSNYELQQFAYVASHDLQEPLRKIRTFGERLQMRNEEKLDGRSLDYIARMNNAAKRMQTLIDDLLSFSRISTQAAPFEPTDLNAVVQEVIIDLETRIEEAQGQIKVEPLPIIEADPLQMRQLLQNLASNGLKFHREDVPPIVIIKGETFSKNDRKTVRIYVTDNGIGIAEEYQERIFQMFQRLHGRTEFDGSGVGLTICRRIVDRHNGTISVSSQPGQGTTFIITLPVKQNR